MAHFWIAYLILDRLIIRRAVALVQHEDQEVAALQQQIAAATAELTEKTKAKEQAWHQMHQALLEQKPSLQTVSLITVKRLGSEEPVPLTKKDITPLVHQFKQIIVDRIAHD